MKNYLYFFYREYCIRNLYQSNERYEVFDSVDKISNFLNLEYDLVFEDRFEEVYFLDLIVDIHAKEICMKHNYHGLTDFYYNKIFSELDNNESCIFFDNLYSNLMSNDDLKKSIWYLFEKSIECGIYASHVRTLLYKNYDLDTMISDIEQYIEPKFYWSVQDSKKYYFFTPSECEVEFDLDPGSNWSGMYALFLDIKSKNFNINETLDFVQSQILFARANYHAAENSIMPESERDMLERIKDVPGVNSVKIEGFQNRLLGLMLWDLVNIKKKGLKESLIELVESKVNLSKIKNCKFKKTHKKCIAVQCKNFDNCYKYVQNIYKVTVESVNNKVVASTNNR